MSQSSAITATLDVAKTGTPLSENIYGQFLEHGGDIVNAGLWSEMLVDSPQPKPAFSAGDQPAVNPGSATYPLDVSAALSKDRKTLAIAVLNPSDAEQSLHLDLHGASLAAHGTLWRMAPQSIDATVKPGSPAQVQVEEQSLGALPATVTLRPFSVNIYSYPVL